MSIFQAPLLPLLPLRLIETFQLRGVFIVYVYYYLFNQSFNQPIAAGLRSAVDSDWLIHYYYLLLPVYYKFIEVNKTRYFDYFDCFNVKINK